MSPFPISRREFLRNAALAAVGLGGLNLLRARCAAAGGEAGKRLNFVFFLIDDMGWMDTGCYGSKVYQTPNIDKLAGESMRFTNAYAACPVCSPTRASIMTGRYPARLHLTDWIAGHVQPRAKLRIPDWTMHLNLEEVTLAEALKPAGYVTASIGKWHLGGPGYLPEKQGFDVNFAGSNAGSPRSYFFPYKVPDVQSGQPGEYLTDRLTDEAEKFIESNKDKPFFLYLPHYAVHMPIQAKKPLIDKHLARGLPAGGENAAPYAAMIDSVDQSVGRVMARLEQSGIADRTVVIFMSDNGGLSGVTSNAPLRAGKGTMYEGGIREPMLVRWPGVVKGGSTCDSPVISVDFYPTMLEMAGVADDPKHVVDGVSLVGLLRQSGEPKRDALYWHYPHYHRTTPCGAVRKGDFKLIEYYEDGRVELYNLKDDIGESNNLAEKMPDKAAELKKMLQDWRTAVNAQMPTPNPDYKPAAASQPAAGGRKKPKATKAQP